MCTCVGFCKHTTCSSVPRACHGCFVMTETCLGLCNTLSPSFQESLKMQPVAKTLLSTPSSQGGTWEGERWGKRELNNCENCSGWAAPICITRTAPSEHRSANQSCAFWAAAKKLHKQVGIIKLQPKSKKDPLTLFSANYCISIFFPRNEALDLSCSTCQLCEDQAAPEAAKPGDVPRDTWAVRDPSVTHMHLLKNHLPRFIYPLHRCQQSKRFCRGPSLLSWQRYMLN